MLWRSADAKQWSPIELPFPASIPREPQWSVWAEHILAIDGRLLVIGSASALDNLQAVAWTSADGVAWTDIPPPPVYAVSDATAGPAGLVVATHGFAVGTGSAWRSTDGGGNWQERPPAAETIETDAVVGTAAGYLIAGASYRGSAYLPRIWGSTDGATWVEQALASSEMPGRVEAVTVDGAGHWVAAGTLDGKPASWLSMDGKAWDLPDPSALADAQRQTLLWRLAGLPAGFILIDAAGSTWGSRDGKAWSSLDAVPSGFRGENAAGVGRIGARVVIIDNVHPFATGAAQEGWRIAVGTAQP
jgi:hypothetical protein